MNKLILTAMAACYLALPLARAQDRALFGEDDTWNLYTRLGVSVAPAGNDDVAWVDLSVGGILNEHFGVGLRLTTLAQEAESAGFDGYNNPDALDITFGGLDLAYTFLPESIVHPSIGLFVGAGQMKLGRSGRDGEKVDLLVVEPSLNLLVNVTARSEVGLGIAYRYADLDPEMSVDDALSGVVGSLFLRLTEF